MLRVESTRSMNEVIGWSGGYDRQLVARLGDTHLLASQFHAADLARLDRPAECQSPGLGCLADEWWLTDGSAVFHLPYSYPRSTRTDCASKRLKLLVAHRLDSSDHFSFGLVCGCPLVRWLLERRSANAV